VPKGVWIAQSKRRAVTIQIGSGTLSRCWRVLLLTCRRGRHLIYVAALSRVWIAFSSGWIMQTLRKISARVGAVIGYRLLASHIAFCGAATVVISASLLFETVSERAQAATDGAERVVVTPSRGSTTISLRDRLVVGLQARLKSEVAFVELVAAKVRTGQLPQRLVDETFLWARQRVLNGRTSRSYRPIVFFEPAMRARARRLKVEL
jgi:hypothetical protein